MQHLCNTYVTLAGLPRWLDRERPDPTDIRVWDGDSPADTLWCWRQSSEIQPCQQTISGDKNYTTLCSYLCHSAVAQLLCCLYTALTLVLNCCHAVVTLRSHCYYTVVILPLYCCYTVVTLLLHCCYAALTILLHYYHIARRLLLHCCYTVVILLLQSLPWSYTVVTLLSHCFYTALNVLSPYCYTVVTGGAPEQDGAGQCNNSVTTV
jgi:hypothetical protein